MGRRLLLPRACFPAQGKSVRVEGSALFFVGSLFLSTPSRRARPGAQLEQLLQLLPLFHLTGQYRQLLPYAPDRLRHRTRRQVEPFQGPGRASGPEVILLVVTGFFAIFTEPCDDMMSCLSEINIDLNSCFYLFFFFINSGSSEDGEKD